MDEKLKHSESHATNSTSSSMSTSTVDEQQKHEKHQHQQHEEENDEQQQHPRPQRRGSAATTTSRSSSNGSEQDRLQYGHHTDNTSKNEAAFQFDAYDAYGVKMAGHKTFEEEEPRTFEDWQWALMHSKVSTELARVEAQNKREEEENTSDSTDSCELRTDKRRRCMDPATDASRAVPAKVSNETRNYRRQQESSGSGSSAGVSSTVEPNCSSSDNSGGNTGMHAKGHGNATTSQKNEETESIATVTSQVDSFTLQNEDAASVKYDDEIQNMTADMYDLKKT